MCVSVWDPRPDGGRVDRSTESANGSEREETPFSVLAGTGRFI